MQNDAKDIYQQMQGAKSIFNNKIVIGLILNQHINALLLRNLDMR